MILTDIETKVDLLNNRPLAMTITGLLRERPDHPVTVGVHGDWGAGKSSILEMIEAELENEEDVLCIKFNGWRFQGFEDAKIALISGIVTGLIEKRPILQKAMSAVKDIFNRIDWLKLAKRTGGLAFASLSGIPTHEQIQSAVTVFEKLVAEPSEIISKDNLLKATEEAKGLMKPEEAKNIPQEVEAFRKAFDQLLRDAGIRQLVVLIDDLDRCLPDTAIETLEAIRLFVFTARTAFVVAADETMIEYAVRKHFPDLPDSTGPRDYARNYLEKLIHVPFRIPALGETETRIYVTLLLVGIELGDGDECYQKLIETAHEKLKRPWLEGGLDFATINDVLGSKAEEARNALTLSDQIGPILASGTKGNPRQIKRFLNTLLLRERTAQARGFGGDIQLPTLAKLMLAERFIPKLFDQIASVAAVHPQGLCENLAALESDLDISYGEVVPSDKRKKKKKSEVAVQSENTILIEWRSQDRICDWARLNPKLTGVDLRPYLFVTRDKKDFFGPMSVLGHLTEIVEKLLGSKLQVQSYEMELVQLAKAEAEKVFEALRAKIMSTGHFDTKPKGLDGLIVLVKAQPELQGGLLDFIDALPSSTCGPWAVSGWYGVITNEKSKERLKSILRGWSKTTDNPMLKTAADNALAGGIG